MRKRLGFSIALLAVLAATTSVRGETITGNDIPNLIYDPLSGILSVDTDGADLISLLIEGPQASSIDRWVDGSSQDGVNGWLQQYFNNKEQWIGNGSAVAGGSVAQGTYDIATYALNLESTDFLSVEIGTQSFGTIFTDVTVGLDPPIACDLDGDGDCDINDIDMLTNTANVTVDQITTWLSQAGPENGKGGPFLMGDANLDGTVNAIDLNAVGQSWQQSDKMWSTGDFTGDNKVDAADLNELGQNWQEMTPMNAAAAAVPEPTSLIMLLTAVAGLAGFRRK